MTQLPPPPKMYPFSFREEKLKTTSYVANSRLTVANSWLKFVPDNIANSRLMFTPDNILVVGSNLHLLMFPTIGSSLYQLTLQTVDQ